jgi:endonuclease YncB( thermonuclease family)
MKTKIILFLCIIPLVLCAQNAVTGKVVKVSDGDTFTILCEDNVQQRIRLNGIDCPESKQDYGQRAKQYLSELIAGKTVTVTYKTKDRYGRILGNTVINNVDVSESLISAGLAWHYKQYDKTRRLAELENQARTAKRGLWAQPNPTPPWEFRKQKK